jgi:hypothetical protein
MQPQVDPCDAGLTTSFRLPFGAAAGRADRSRIEAPAARPPHLASQDAEFVALQMAYRASGGLANGNELATRLHVRGESGYARLASWILRQQVFSFAWNQHFWLPMFQFDPADLSLRQELQPVLAELAGVMDGWALAAWFARPCDSLQGRSPLSQCVHDQPAVFQAARLQRFVIRG